MNRTALINGTILSLLTVTSLSGQSACPPIGDPGTKTATISLRTTDGSCDLSSGGFLKQWSTYKAHFRATVTGGCTTRKQECSGLPPVCACVVSASYLRNLGTTYLFDSAQGSTPFAAIAAASNVQSIDTTVPTGTSSTGSSWLASVLGEHTFTSNTGWNQTPCMLEPATFTSDQPFMANVVACKPEWWMLAGTTEPLHVPAGDIYLYIPPNMWTQLSGPASAAATDWNNAFGGTITVHVTQNDCGTNGDCIKVREDNSSSGCAALSGPTGGWDHTTGLVQSYQYLSLPTDSRAWTNRSADRLKRTIAHELGHAFGLNEYASSCAVGKSVMAPTSDPACTSTTGMVLSPTPSDILPAKSTYGNRVRSVCGF
jgi:hypothetical protein